MGNDRQKRVEYLRRIADPRTPDEALESVERLRYAEEIPIEELLQVADKLTPPPPPKPLFPHTSADRIRNDVMLERIGPSVKQTRERLFNSEAVPFRSLKAAVQWIEDTADASKVQLSDKEQKRARGLRSEIFRLIAKLSAITKHHYGFPASTQTVEYYRPGSRQVIACGAPIGSPLELLATSSAAIANATGLWKAQVVAYVLAGIRPELATVALWQYPDTYTTLPTGEPYRRSYVQVTFNSPDITDEQLRTLRREIRGTWNAHRSKPLTERDEQLLEIVNELGGVPNSGRTEFWKRVAVEYGKRVKPVGSFETLKSRYRRLQKKLQEQE